MLPTNQTSLLCCSINNKKVLKHLFLMDLNIVPHLLHSCFLFGRQGLFFGLFSNDLLSRFFCLDFILESMVNKLFLFHN